MVNYLKKAQKIFPLALFLFILLSLTLVPVEGEKQISINSTGSFLAPSYKLSPANMSITIRTSKEQYTQGETMSVNATIVDLSSRNPIGNAEVEGKLIRAGAILRNITDFKEVKAGNYIAKINTTDMDPGWWDVKIIAKKSGYETGEKTTQVAILPKPEKTPAIPITFLIPAIIAIALVTVLIGMFGFYLFQEKKKPRKKGK